jgi:hypothetical protein
MDEKFGGPLLLGIVFLAALSYLAARRGKNKAAQMCGRVGLMIVAFILSLTALNVAFIAAEAARDFYRPAASFWETALDETALWAIVVGLGFLAIRLISQLLPPHRIQLILALVGISRTPLLSC